MRMAIFLLLGLSSYARPSELLRCTTNCLIAPSARVTDHWSLVLNPEEESGRVRRQRPLRLCLVEALGRTALPGVGARSWKPAAVGLRVLRLSELLQPGGQSAPVARLSLPVAAQWTFDRHQSASPHPRRGAEARAVEKPEECHQVREKRQTGHELQCVASQGPAALPRGRVTSRGGDGRHGPRAPGLVRWRGRQGFYVMDLFSGSGGVSRAVRSLGFSAKEWDLLWGARFDLVKPHVISRVRSEIRSGYVLGAMLAPPCLSFSAARDRTSAIRTAEYPWGVPAFGLQQKDLESLHEGNKIFECVIQVLRWLDELSLPWILEHPRSSKCWLLPPVQALLTAPHTSIVYTDMCQWGTRWKRPTTLLAGNVDSQDLQRLRRLCHGRSGNCSRSGGTHFAVSGLGPGHVPWTQVSHTYPKQFCHALAFALTAAYHIDPPSQPLRTRPFGKWLGRL